MIIVLFVILSALTGTLAIHGGRPFSIKRAPYMAQITAQKGGQRIRFQGILLDFQMVLTNAYYCTSAVGLRVYAGNSMEAQFFGLNVLNVHNHEKFVKGNTGERSQNNLCVIHLNGTFEESPLIQRAPIAGKNHHVAPEEDPVIVFSYACPGMRYNQTRLYGREMHFDEPAGLMVSLRKWGKQLGAMRHGDGGAAIYHHNSHRIFAMGSDDEYTQAHPDDRHDKPAILLGHYRTWLEQKRRELHELEMLELKKRAKRTKESKRAKAKRGISV